MNAVPIPPYFEYPRVEVVRVIDGDTIIALLDMGCKIYHKVRCRLKDLDAPSLREPGGVEAKDYLQALINAEPQITIRTFKGDRQDTYGRYLVELFGAHGSLNDLMVSSGHAKAVKY